MWLRNDAIAAMKMGKIQNIARHALVTFKSIDTPSFSINLESLKAMVSLILHFIAVWGKFIWSMTFRKHQQHLNACLGGRRENVSLLRNRTSTANSFELVDFKDTFNVSLFIISFPKFAHLICITGYVISLLGTNR